MANLVIDDVPEQRALLLPLLWLRPRTV